MIALLRKAIDLGMDFFDTAETYGPWTNETMVGEAFRGLREEGDADPLRPCRALRRRRRFRRDDASSRGRNPARPARYVADRRTDHACDRGPVCRSRARPFNVAADGVLVRIVKER